MSRIAVADLRTTHHRLAAVARRLALRWEDFAMGFTPTDREWMEKWAAHNRPDLTDYRAKRAWYVDLKVRCHPDQH